MEGRGRGAGRGAEGDGERGEVGRDGAGPCGGHDGELRLLQQPLDGLAVRLVAQLPRAGPWYPRRAAHCASCCTSPAPAAGAMASDPMNGAIPAAFAAAA